MNDDEQSCYSHSNDDPDCEKKPEGEEEEEEKKELTEREKEDQEDILSGSLEDILRKLEVKGTENKEIEKYKEMRLWRLKRDKNVRE